MASSGGVDELSIGVLGPLEVRNGDRLIELPGRRERIVLAALALQPGRPLSVATLMDLLWAEDPPRTADKTLQTYMSRLRKVVGADRIDRREAGYVLDVAPHNVDVHRFHDLVRQALAGPTGERAAALGVALALWRADEPADLGATPAAVALRESLVEARLAAIEELADAGPRAGPHATPVAELEGLVGRYPYRERLWAALMVALYRGGRQADALAAFTRARTVMDTELGVEPSPRLRQLEQQILNQDPSLDVSSASSREQAARPVGVARSNLPAELTSLIGREEVLTAVHRLLAEARLVTLTGPGGVGKTRVALRAAAEAAGRYPGGVYLVELAATPAPGVGHSVAEALGVQLDATTSVSQALSEALRERTVLLVLDNCEHVLDPARDLTQTLLRDCPSVRVLTTSRAPLDVEGEHTFELSPLDVEGEDAAAVRLFCQRATAADPRFDPSRHRPAIIELCRRLDGLPLALELAAARARTLAPEDITVRLDQRFGLLDTGRVLAGRPRGLRETLDWSHELLSAPEQAVFRRASVFAGSFTVAAAEQVCAGAQAETYDVARAVAGLAEQSLLSGKQGRYRMLQTVRAYAAERLQEAGEEVPTRHRHAASVTALAEELEHRRRGPNEPEAVRELEAELPNLRAAHAWACEAGDADLALRLSLALHWSAYFGMRAELFEWATAAAERFESSGHPLIGDVCGSAAVGAMQAGDPGQMVALAERGRALARRAGRGGSVLAAYALGQQAMHAGDFRRATQIADEIDGLEPDGYAACLWQGMRVGMLAYQGNRQDAVNGHARLSEGYRSSGSPTLRAWSLYGLGEALSELRPDDAVDVLRECVETANAASNRLIANIASVTLSSLAGRFGEPTAALESFAVIISRWEEQGAWSYQWTTLRSLVELLARVGCAEEAVALYEAGSSSSIAPPLYGEQGLRLANLLDDLRSELGQDAFERATRTGASLSDAEAVTLAHDAITRTRTRLQAAGQVERT